MRWGWKLERAALTQHRHPVSVRGRQNSSTGVQVWGSRSRDCALFLRAPGRVDSRRPGSFSCCWSVEDLAKEWTACGRKRCSGRPGPARRAGLGVGSGGSTGRAEPGARLWSRGPINVVSSGDKGANQTQIAAEHSSFSVFHVSGLQLKNAFQ